MNLKNPQIVRIAVKVIQSMANIHRLLVRNRITFDIRPVQNVFAQSTEFAVGFRS